MKPSARIVNTSRGPIIDQDALIQALTEGWIAGAAVDVFDEEPLPVDHPFRKLENLVMTPHTGYVTIETYRTFYREMVEDIKPGWTARRSVFEPQPGPPTVTARGVRCRSIANYRPAPKPADRSASA